MPTHPPGLVIPALIVGLGNPGSKYDRTRHNIGFDAIDQLAKRWQIPLADQRRFRGLVGDGLAMPGHRIRLLKPQTYMNKSGQSIRAVLDWFKLSPQSVLLVYDDMDLPVGKIRLRLSGSAGGHNGMKSTISHLGTQDFPRLRIGISNPQASGPTKDTISHVLGRFTPQENQVIPKVLEGVVQAVEMSLTQGVEKSMSLYNGLDLATS